MKTRTQSPDGATYCDISPQVDDIYNRIAWQEIKSDKLGFIRKICIGIPRIWYFSSTSRKTLAAEFLGWPLLLLAVLGTPALLLRRPNYLPILLPLVFTTLAFAAVQCHYRYSMPIAGLLITYSAAGLLTILGKPFGPLGRRGARGRAKPAKERLTSLSYFFPAHNEVDNIGLVVDDALRILPDVANEFEIIIVDDGSTDGTREAADALVEQHPQVRVVHHETNKGYGGALQSGFAASRFDYIAFTDGDRQFDLSDINRFVEEIADCDHVIGYRRKRVDPIIRTINAKAYKALVRLVLGLGVRDIDCAFKLFRADQVKGIKLRSSGALISAEMLTKLALSGALIKEVPVTRLPRVMGEQSGAKLKVILRMFGELPSLYLSILRQPPNPVKD